MNGIPLVNNFAFQKLDFDIFTIHNIHQVFTFLESDRLYTTKVLKI